MYPMGEERKNDGSLGLPSRKILRAMSSRASGKALLEHRYTLKDRKKHPGVLKKRNEINNAFYPERQFIVFINAYFCNKGGFVNKLQ